MDSSFVRLRRSELMGQMGRSINVQINSYTDPVASSLNITSEALKSGAAKYGLSKNDLL